MDKDQRITDLETQVADLKQQLHDKEIHRLNDLHRLRARVIKVLRPEVARIRDVIKAVCERTPPKVGVADAYLNDTIHVIDALLKSLEEEGRK